MVPRLCPHVFQGKVGWEQDKELVIEEVRWDVGMWTGLGWPRIGTGGGRL